MINIVLFEPEIPQNTGNIVRLCAATGCSLHLIGPLGFSLQNRFLKRAGLDYWQLADLHIYDSYEDFNTKHQAATFYYVTSTGEHYYTEFHFQPGDFLVFGSETHGLPEELLARKRESCLRIPMVPRARCLNLSNTVAIVMFHALHQQMFRGLI